MNKNAEKIFDMFGLKPGDKFKIEEVGSFSSLSTKTFCILIGNKFNARLLYAISQL